MPLDYSQDLTYRFSSIIIVKLEIVIGAKFFSLYCYNSFIITIFFHFVQVFLSECCYEKCLLICCILMFISTKAKV